MERIDFNSGRFYGPKGQEITCVKIGTDVLLIDHTRMLEYYLPSCPLQVMPIMQRYDANWTEPVVSADLRVLSSKIQSEYDGIFFQKIPC